MQWGCLDALLDLSVGDVDADRAGSEQCAVGEAQRAVLLQHAIAR